MFKLDLSDTFEYPVKFTTVDAKGRQQNHQFIGVFKRLERDEIVNNNSYDEKPGKLSGEEVIEADLDYLMAFLVDWKGVDIGGDATFSRENLRLLLKGVPSMHLAIGNAFSEASNGGRQRKN
jgi:hypothetical protein